jgi:hypothetical protein
MSDSCAGKEERGGEKSGESKGQEGRERGLADGEVRFRSTDRRR